MNPLNSGRPISAQRSDDEQRSQHGELRRKTAVERHVIRPVALVEKGDENQQGSAGDSLVDGLVDRAVETSNGKAEDAEGAEAEVAEDGEGDEALHIGLRQGDERSVEKTNDSENDHQRGNGARLRREQSQIEAKDGVESELACDDHSHRGRRFLNNVGEPAMEREDGNLDCKRNQKSQRDPPQSLGREGSVGEERLKPDEVEGVRFCVEPENGDQKQRGGNKRVEEKLKRCGSTTVAAQTWQSESPWAPATAPRSRNRGTDRGRRRRRSSRSAAAGRGNRTPSCASRWRARK